jgi:hypothetical protein
MKQKISVWFVMIFVMMGWGFQAAAQEKSADNMQFVIEKLQADKRLLVAGNMELTETEAQAFWPVYDQYQHELFLLRARTLGLIKSYAQAYNTTMDNDTARALMDEMLAIESLGLTLRQVYLPDFRRVLPDVKVVRYYQIENKLNAALMFLLAKDIPLIVETAKQ